MTDATTSTLRSRVPARFTDEDLLGLGLEGLIRLLGEEIEATMQVLPPALARRWEASPVPKSRDDHRSGTGERPDPTADTVLDTRRLALSDAISHAENSLRYTVSRLRASRLRLEGAVARYDGEES